MHPGNIDIHDFLYDLPDDKIAKFPLPERDASKLLVYKHNMIAEDVYINLPQHIPEDTLLVFNDTKVIEARILFQKPTGASIEIFCLEPYKQSDIPSAMQQQKKVWWKCLVGGISKWKPGQVLQKEMVYGEEVLILNATYIEKQVDCFLIEFSWSPAELHFAEVLHLVGLVPLPPYIKRAAGKEDVERYQTVYALYDGSVAAPTAGLHFTKAIFDQLPGKNIRKEFVTLHVGAGTFKPVKSDLLADHEMHAEFIQVSYVAIENIIQHLHKPIIPVGTTSLRTIESLYWLGLKTIREPGISAESLVIQQWDAYNENFSREVSSKEALESLQKWMRSNQLDILFTKTQLLIAPGYVFHIASALITNFHQPQSTLLLIIAALTGENWKSIYSYALNHEFRFLSYGDGSLLFRSGEKKE